MSATGSRLRDRPRDGWAAGDPAATLDPDWRDASVDGCWRLVRKGSGKNANASLPVEGGWRTTDTRLPRKDDSPIASTDQVTSGAVRCLRKSLKCGMLSIPIRDDYHPDYGT
jgi:hypothetical protein